MQSRPAYSMKSLLISESETVKSVFTVGGDPFGWNTFPSVLSLPIKRFATSSFCRFSCRSFLFSLLQNNLNLHTYLLFGVGLVMYDTLWHDVRLLCVCDSLHAGKARSILCFVLCCTRNLKCAVGEVDVDLFSEINWSLYQHRTIQLW